MNKVYFTEEKKREIVESLMDVKKDAEQLVKEIRILKDVIRDLILQTDELRRNQLPAGTIAVNCKCPNKNCLTCRGTGYYLKPADGKEEMKK